MKYLFETCSLNYEDFASGRVLYNAQGTTSFPVRLSSEIVQRCFSILDTKGIKGPYSIYDPCCGGAYMLTVIGLMHSHVINKIHASDINPEVLRTAERNLSLLTAGGLARRKEELTRLTALYQKKSHEEALASLEKFNKQSACSALKEIVIAQGDITTAEKRHIHDPFNIVMTDLPYGDKVNWITNSSNPVSDFFDQISKWMDTEKSIAAIIANKDQKLKHEKFKRLQYFKVGKRQIGIFELIS
ncbi:hypothetical protein [Paenibacillus sp. FSL R7-0652]|uniref:rRNA methyltransferase AviRa n=1 Tax=Paenibacillus sp. AN1007 TaxID=3151385 RepID=A0AAU8NIS9_9BACL